MVCAGVIVTLAMVTEPDFPGSSYVPPDAGLSGRTPAPGFEPPRAIA